MSTEDTSKNIYKVMTVKSHLDEINTEIKSLWDYVNMNSNNIDRICEQHTKINRTINAALFLVLCCGFAILIRGLI